MIEVRQIQLRHLFKVVSGATPETGNQEFWDGEIVWITPEDVSQVEGTGVIFNSRRKITEFGYKNCGTTIAPSNSIVLTKRAPIGQLAILGVEACSNQGCFLLISKSDVDSKFYYYFLFSQKEKLQILGRGSTFMELSTDDIKSLYIPHLNSTLQRRIAAYLDQETARIDALIAAKERLLTLLAEKRQALITRAVTRGLDPNVKMKDSGVEWLGDVPQHWKIEKAKWLFGERNEKSATGEEELLTVSHITGITARSEKNVNMFEAESTEGYKIVCENDLVINTLWAWMGAMGVSPLDGIVSPAYHVYKISEHLDPSYVNAISRIPIFATEVTRFSKGVWSSRLRLYPEGLYEVLFPVPPIEEQRLITNFINKENSKIESLRSLTVDSIILLKERRSVLISAAVTGQIETLNK